MKITARLLVAGCLCLFGGTLCVRPQILRPILFTNTTVVPPPLSGMLLWWAADVGNNCSGSACSDGGSQNSWADGSGNGNTGTLTSAISAACVASVYHTNQINGRPALTFNGNTSTGSETCFSVGNSGTGLNNKAASSMFIVVKEANSSATVATYAAGAGSSLQWDNHTNNLNRLTQACTADIATGNAAYDSSWHQLNATYNSSTGAYSFRKDRTSDGSGTNVKTISSNWLSLGATFCGGSISTLNGQIAEFILYNRGLSGGEILTVETYLNGKYGL